MALQRQSKCVYVPLKTLPVKKKDLVNIVAYTESVQYMLVSIKGLSKCSSLRTSVRRLSP